MLVGILMLFAFAQSLFYLFIFDDWGNGEDQWFKDASDYKPYAQIVWPLVIPNVLPGFSAFAALRNFKIPIFGLLLSMIFALIFANYVYTVIQGSFDSAYFILILFVAAFGFLLSLIGAFLNRAYHKKLQSEPPD